MEEGNPLVSGESIGDDAVVEQTLRPACLADYVGQERIKANLAVFLQAAVLRGEPLDHVLLYGPPGLGKTTLAHVIAHEMGARIQTTAGPSIEKPGDLAASEWRVVAEHPRIGQVVLEQAGALRDAATIVLHHHEWYDGRGYPHGLAGGNIPIGARIVSIVDAYEAMIGGRPYRTAISHEEAIAEMRRQAGVQFDPELVEMFALLFPAGVPWAPEAHEHDHDDADGSIPWHAVETPARGRRSPAERVLRERTTAELHDAVHEQRRRAV